MSKEQAMQAAFAGRDSRPEGHVGGEQVIRLVTSRLHCMAAAVEATSPPHTSGTSVECPPSLLSYLPSPPDSHVRSTKLQARSKLRFEDLLPVA